MTGAELVLAPFPGLPAPAGVAVHVTARREGPVLHLAWRLAGPAGAIAFPAPAAMPGRLRGLWDATCCEFFLAAPGRPGYWEFNLSPAGPWNAFHLAAYRAGMVEEPALQALPFAVERAPGSCDVALRLDLTPLGLGAAPWRLNVAAVVADPAGGQSFWAAAHPGAEPDFHHPDAFVVVLDA